MVMRMQMNVLFDTITNSLQKAGCDSPAFDACCLLEDLAALPRGADPRFYKEAVDEKNAADVLAAAKRRADGEPLQYILGEWEFLSLTLKVGAGVLIPRPDTELLCETVADKLALSDSRKVLDLCAGSGCVGLGIASLLSDTTVTAVELSEEAIVYLKQNIERYPFYDVTLVHDDVLSPSLEYATYDVIVSNPPYIPSGDIAGLMREVQHEPRMALDGDTDGLRFYRAILAQWLPRLKEGGLLAVEIGIGQKEIVAHMFDQAGLADIEVLDDLGGIARVVSARRKKIERK